MKNLLLTLFLLPTLIFSQTQIGSDINGEATFNESGVSVSLSSDGTIVAIGAHFNDGSDIDSGHVRVYKNTGGIWTQIGQDIDGEAASDLSGFSVSLSADGSVVAIGAPFNGPTGIDKGQVRIYENIGGVWTQLGQDIDGEANLDRFGSSVSLSANGSIVAIGATRNDGLDKGHVRVYQNVGGVWTQLGQDIDGQKSLEYFGTSVSLSSDGSVVAIGGPFNNGNISEAGIVRVYEYIGGVWTQLGQEINGTMVGDKAGISVSLSSNGNILAIGAPFNDSNGNHSGQVRVYEYQTNNWVQLGSDLVGAAENDWLGSSVSLSADGRLLAIGAFIYNGLGTEFGYVQIYGFQTNNWVQLGSDIIGEEVDDGTGYSVSLSLNGDIVALGSPLNDGNGTDSGQVRVFELSSVLSTDEFVLSQFNLYPNPTNSQIRIQISENLQLEKINFYNNLGQLIEENINETIDVSKLSKGIYFVEIVTVNGSATKKVIVE